MPLTREQRERYNAIAREKAAAKAIAAGRVPGKAGQPSKGRTEDELREMRRIKSQKQRDKDPEANRKYKREYEKRRAAEAAVAAGRLPGKCGRKPIFLTEEERKAKQNARVKRYYHEHLEKSRAKAAKRERDKRAALKAGTYAPRSKARMPEEHRIAVAKAAVHARRARMKDGGKGPQAADLRKLRWRQNGICPYCFINLGTHDIHLDHWIPLAKGGNNDFDNLRLLHGTCNLKKGARHPDEFAPAYAMAKAA